MRKLISILVIANISISLLAETMNNDTIGSYATIFSVKYRESSGYNYHIVFMADYYLEIRPKEINCQTSDDRKLLYEEPICIQATKGFPKETYKWRYSYMNANGVTIVLD